MKHEEGVIGQRVVQGEWSSPWRVRVWNSALNTWMHFFSYPKRCEKTCTVQSCGLKGFGGGVVAHNSFIYTTSCSAISWGSPTHSRLAATAKSPDTKKAREETRPKSMRSLTCSSQTHFIYTRTQTHSHTLNTNGWSYKSLKYRWTIIVTSSSTPLLRSQLPFLHSLSPSHHHHSPCSRSSPSPLLSVYGGEKKTQIKSAFFFFHSSVNLWQFKNMLIPPSCGCCRKNNNSPLNPSLQISGTCWRRCVCPSHAAPWCVSDKEPPGRI